MTPNARPATVIFHLREGETLAEAKRRFTLYLVWAVGDTPDGYTWGDVARRLNITESHCRKIRAEGEES